MSVLINLPVSPECFKRFLAVLENNSRYLLKNLLRLL